MKTMKTTLLTFDVNMTVELTPLRKVKGRFGPQWIANVSGVEHFLPGHQVLNNTLEKDVSVKVTLIEKGHRHKETVYDIEKVDDPSPSPKEAKCDDCRIIKQGDKYIYKNLVSLENEDLFELFITANFFDNLLPQEIKLCLEFNEYELECYGKACRRLDYREPHEDVNNLPY